MKRIGIFCSSSNKLDEIYYQEAERLGRWMGENGKTLVYGGANCGLMETLAKAMHETGGHVLGVVPQILVDRNRVSTSIDETIHTRDLNDRKQQLIEQSEVILALPGSVGTLDEVFTVMAANTIGIHSKKVIFWNINGFWNGLFAMFEQLLTTGVVNKPFEEMMLRADTLEELQQLLTADESSPSSQPELSENSPSSQPELSEYEKYRQMQIQQFEDDITEGRCYPEMPEGQFVRSK